MSAFTQPSLLDLPQTPQGAGLREPSPASVEGGPHAAVAAVPTPRPAVTRDELDAIWHDWRPWAVDDRAVVLHAIAHTAADCGGLVHAADVRRHLTREVAPTVIGAVVCALVRQGVLEDTGWVRRLGEGTMRNRTKRLPVRRLVRPIEMGGAAERDRCEHEQRRARERDAFSALLEAEGDEIDQRSGASSPALPAA